MHTILRVLRRLISVLLVVRRIMRGSQRYCVHVYMIVNVCVYIHAIRYIYTYRLHGRLEFRTTDYCVCGTGMYIYMYVHMYVQVCMYNVLYQVTSNHHSKTSLVPVCESVGTVPDCR